MVWSARLKPPLAVAAESVIAVAAATAAVVLLDGMVAIAGLAIAVVVAARLLTSSRRQAAQAAVRADQALAREREATLLTEAASSLLASPSGSMPAVVGTRMEKALSAAGARMQLCHAPSPRPGEAALPLRTSGESGWLYVDRNTWTREDADRIQRALSELVALAQQRARVAEHAADSEAMRRADVAKTAIIESISDDLRTPLTAISTAAGALREDNVSDDDRREIASVVSVESSRLERTVDDLLDLSRIDAGAVNPKADWCDLHVTVVRATEQVRAARGEFPVSIDVPGDLPPVHVDPAQLERVFTNLIDNAAKFSPSGKPVEVRGICANGRVTIRVVDHGRGIPPAEHSKVFKPFVRGRDAQRGSGLGLAICRGFVEANGGRITLQSRGREGSAFAVSFPAAEQPSPVS